MDETQVAPTEVTNDPQQPVTAPPPEQAPTTTAAPTEASATSDKALLAAYTQSQQRLSAVATALGIPKTSTPEQFVAAISARRQALTDADDELEQDPRLAARAAALRAREQAIAKQTYGDVADLTVTLTEAVRGGTSILELTEIVSQHVIEAAAARFGGAPAQAGGSPAPQQAPQQPQVSTPEQAIAQQAPERDLDAEYRGNAGMFDPGIQPDRAKGPAGFFDQVMGRVSPRLGGTAPR